MSKTDKERAATSLIHTHPEIIDYYIKYKEETEEQASFISKRAVKEVKHFLIRNYRNELSYYIIILIFIRSNQLHTMKRIIGLYILKKL